MSRIAFSIPTAIGRRHVIARNLGIQFSDEFSVDRDWLKENNIFNPMLDIDTQLFIDPFLLPYSKHKEISDTGFDAYEAHFQTIFRLLSLSEEQGDKAWQAAYDRFLFSEKGGMSGTCIGYSTSTKGHAFGPVKSTQALKWAKGVIILGVKDPEMFSALGLFEKGIGADLISDMVLHITLDSILEFNRKVYKKIEKELGVKIELSQHTLAGREASLPSNPCSDQNHPIILLPSDILKHLPVLDDPRGISETADFNDGLRKRINKHLSVLFELEHKNQKDRVLTEAQIDADAFQTLLDALKKLERKAYDFETDPNGLLSWLKVGRDFATQFPLDLTIDRGLSRIEQIDSVCLRIIDKYKQFVEIARISKDLYDDEGNPKREGYAQRIFRMIADVYCEQSDVDLSPESDKGAGPVDFKLSRGKDKITVELKLSTNSKLVQGYEKQLEAYTLAEGAKRSHYVIIDVGKMGKKFKKLQAFIKDNPPVGSNKRVHYIDGIPRQSASKL